MRTETASYLMLFCTLLLVKKDLASLEQSLAIVPLTGKARELAAELVH